MRKLYRRDVLQILIAIDACRGAINWVTTMFDFTNSGEWIYDHCPDSSWLVYLIYHGTTIEDARQRIARLNVFDCGLIWEEGKREDLIRKEFPYEEVIENLHPKVIHMLDALEEADQMHG